MVAAFFNSHSSIDMRVISGQFRGRKLRGPRGAEIRPTGDRLKESLFNILDPSIQGTVFVDVFAGTGAIGIEALSRGARQVVFVDSSREGCRLTARIWSCAASRVAFGSSALTFSPRSAFLSGKAFPPIFFSWILPTNGGLIGTFWKSAFGRVWRTGIHAS